jgi:hypothetical protein
MELAPKFASYILRIPHAANPYADSIVSFTPGKTLWIVLSFLCVA